METQLGPGESALCCWTLLEQQEPSEVRICGDRFIWSFITVNRDHRAAVMQTNHSREQQTEPGSYQGSLTAQVRCIALAEFWSGWVDTTTVDLEWRQSHTTIRLFKLRSYRENSLLRLIQDRVWKWPKPELSRLDSVWFVLFTLFWMKSGVRPDYAVHSINS